MDWVAVIEETASRILRQTPGEVVAYRLLRDVLRRPAGDSELERAKEGLDRSRCVQDLGNEQWEDGGWGAFHSRSTRRKQRIISTEVGIERALALGLDSTHPILQKASRYIISILEGERRFPDYHEKNDRWQTGMRLFLASTLSLIEPAHPLLDADRRLWVRITERTFQAGKYDEEDEVQAHAELTGATVRDSYLVLNNRYSLNILGSAPGLLSQQAERALLSWLWEQPEGIGYLEVPLGAPPPYGKAGPFDRWLASLEMLARLFPHWVDFAGDGVAWLRGQRDERGYWDFGSRPSCLSYFPLSDSWRRRQDRVFDWTTRVLALLRRFHDPGGT